MMRLRRYIVAGLLVWVPLGITLFVLNVVVGIMDRTLLLLPFAYRPENLLGIKIPGLGIVLTVIVLIVTGAGRVTRGDTATGVTKKVICETGLEVKAPQHIKVGERIGNAGTATSRRRAP